MWKIPGPYEPMDVVTQPRVFAVTQFSRPVEISTRFYYVLVSVAF